MVYNMKEKPQVSWTKWETGIVAGDKVACPICGKEHTLLLNDPVQDAMDSISLDNKDRKGVSDAVFRIKLEKIPYPKMGEVELVYDCPDYGRLTAVIDGEFIFGIKA